MKLTLCIVVVVQIVFYSVRGQILSFCKDQREGQVCEIICTTPDHSKDVVFLKTNDPLNTIGGCSPNCGAIPPYSANQPNTTTTVLSFPLQRTDAVEWQCLYGSTPAFGTLKWGTFPTSIEASGFPSNITIHSEQETDVKLKCLYSEELPQVTLYHQDINNDTVTPLAPVTCNIASDTCTDVNFTSYLCNVKIANDDQLDCNTQYSLGIYVKVYNIETLDISKPLGTGITYECENGGNGDDNCIVILITLVFFAVSLIVITITFFVVLLLSCKFPNIGKVVIIMSFLLIDVMFEIIILWGIEYGSNFKLFKSDSECRVVVIGVVCHLVTLLIEVVKAVVLYRYMNKLKKRFFGTCISPESKPTEKAQIDVNDRKTRSNLISKGSEGRSPHSAEDRTEKDAKPEDVMILMHFTLPEGYSVDTWASEKTSSINDSSKYHPSDRGSLCIKAATKMDNGIYQSILKSNDSEQRINAVLHVTEQTSVSLVIHPLIWRRLSSKKLKKMSELKDVRHKLSTNDDIKMKQEDKYNISVRSVRWTHNGRGIPSNYDNDDKEVCSLEVTKRDPIDEYHCTVEFSNKKSHMYIFIVKFTGARSGNTQSSTLAKNKVDTTSEDVIGVPTVMNTKREHIMPSLPHIRNDDLAHGNDSISESRP